MSKPKILLLFFVVAALVGVVIISISQKTTTKNNVITTTKNSTPHTIFAAPLNNAFSRITKKPFGIYVSPKNSPVTPEKFTGYHTGVDFETFPAEQNKDISIVTICDGKLLEKKQARGYGGMVVQSCLLDNSPIVVIYGHVRLSSVKNSVGEILKTGNFLGFLGTGYSTETDGERKHLHLGIHRGEKIDTRGYVQTESELKNWIDIKEYLK